MKSRSYFYCGFTTTLNIVVNALTFGKFLWLEGRVSGGVFRNWARRFKNKPEKFVLPETEQEIIEIIRTSSGVRLFGAGHSFNDGVVSDFTLISLDNYKGIISEDLPNKQITFKGGTRMRDVIKLLLERGLAFSSLPSHDAQSIAGIISTDVHGTGRDWGFVSELVHSIKVIDGKGDVHICGQTDELFGAAIGGVGAVGIITEVTVNAVPRFNIEQICRLSDLETVEADLEQLIEDNDHISLYIFPFAEKCQINIWNRTEKPQSFLGDLREWFNISLDALTSAWFGNLMAYTGTLKKFSNIAYHFKQMTDLVLESAEGYTRTIYPLHQEFEFTVPYNEAIQRCNEFLKLFEDMYLAEPKTLPYTLLEVRFTPANRTKALIGAGQGERRCWIDLICNDSHGFEKYYAVADVMIKDIKARPHLGKFGLDFNKAYLAELYGENFDKFLELMHEHDPENKFANDFTRRLFRD
ncbi:D-arabinono-1,4-lactone oxidase [soil metagenome]